MFKKFLMRKGPIQFPEVFLIRREKFSINLEIDLFIKSSISFTEEKPIKEGLCLLLLKGEFLILQIGMGEFLN